MIKRLFLPVFVFILCFSGLSYGQSQIGISGAIDDSFEKDFRNTPFPRDKNAKIITEKELLDNLPKETSAETVYVSRFEVTGNRVIDKKDIQMVLIDYVERNLTLTQLNEAADAVTKFYRQKGYIISYASTDQKIYVNLKATNLDGIGYGIGNPKNGSEGNYIWSLRTYNSNSASDISAKQRELYCIKANYGDTWNANQENIVEYNLSYNLQEEREKLVELLGKDASNEANQKVIELLNAETGYYKEIIWLLDNAYIAGTTDKTSYLEKIGIKYDEEYKVYYYEPTDGYDYSDIAANGEYTYLLTDEDIKAVQKTAIWYYTNYKIENQEEFNLKDKVDWLTITTDGQNYNQLADISRPSTSEGADRDEIAKILYNYLVDAAEKNADQYTAENGYKIGEPAKVNTEGLLEDGQGRYKLTTRREGENYIIVKQEDILAIAE